MTAKTQGYRSGTRSKFAKPFRRHGAIRMKNYLQKHKIGEYVDIIVDGAIHRGMPHHFYHGRTGRIFNVAPRSIGVTILKQVRNRREEKRLNVRIEHIRKSDCRTKFLDVVRKNDALRTEANKKKEKLCLKRQPQLPQESKTVSFGLDTLKVTNALPYMVIH